VKPLDKISDPVLKQIQYEDTLRGAHRAEWGPRFSKPSLHEFAGPDHSLAVGLIAQFVQRTGGGKFPQISREDVAEGLFKRIKNPGMVTQGSSYLCGPAAFFHSMLYRNQVTYVKFVTELYDNGAGAAHLGHLLITPSNDLKMAQLPPGMSASDWIALASLRDSENVFFDYQVRTFPVDKISSLVEGMSGDTQPADMVKWFKGLGYTKVEDLTLSSNDGGSEQFRQHVEKANQYYRSGYKVCLLICSNMLDASTMATSGGADHWVVMNSPINLSDTSNVTCTFFTWGTRQYRVPFRTTNDPSVPSKLTLKQFLANYYGFVAATR
jgi:hypothetical protein